MVLTASDGDGDVAIGQSAQISEAGAAVDVVAQAVGESDGGCGARVQACNGVGDGGLLGVADEVIADGDGEVAEQISAGVQCWGGACEGAVGGVASGV